MSIKINTSDLDNAIIKLEKDVKSIDYTEVAEASLLKIGSISRKDYLRGPRPNRLGVVTNRLRDSIGIGTDGIINIVKTPDGAKGTVGTTVEYASKHEFGYGVRPRPFLAPALEDFKKNDLAKIIRKFLKGILWTKH